MATTVDFSTFQGDSLNQVFTCLDEAGLPVDISDATQVIWKAYRSDPSAISLVKSLTAGNITVDQTSPANGKFTVQITSSDTQSLTDYYEHMGTVTTPAGVTTYIVGRWQVGPQPQWSYSGDPATSPMDTVRFLVGDTDESNPQLTDAEIDSQLLQWPNPYLCASNICNQIAAKYARRVNKRVGDLQINYTDMAKQYYILAANLAEQAATMGIMPYAGGVSISDMNTVDLNNDRNKPPFGIGQFDYFPPPGEAGSAQTEGGGGGPYGNGY